MLSLLETLLVRLVTCMTFSLASRNYSLYVTSQKDFGINGYMYVRRIGESNKIIHRIAFYTFFYVRDKPQALK